MLYFAVIRDLLDKTEERWETRATTVGELAEELEGTYSALRGYLASVRFAVNETFVSSTHGLKEGDTIAIIPPVSGG